jgi:SAM-dependent methyltransferase
MTDPVESLVAEQIAYYRASAPEYASAGVPGLAADELDEVEAKTVTALERFHAAGDVLELACGPGTWTPLLATHADTLTAVDASPEMLRLAAARVDDSRVRFVEADLFSWEPDRRYDAVFFGFWLSHVPLERFASFWALVDRCLGPEGRVAFVDDAYRTPEELVEGATSSLIQRRLSDGTAFRAVKVPHTPDSLEARIRALGWDIAVHYLAEPFFWGSGARAGGTWRWR